MPKQDKVILDDRKPCLWCGRLFAPRVYSSHRCSRRKIGAKFFKFWQAHADEADCLRYPTLDSWHIAVTEGKITIQDYPFTGSGVPEQQPADAQADSGGDLDNSDDQVQDKPAGGDSLEVGPDSSEPALSYNADASFTAPPLEEAQTRTGVMNIAQKVTSAALETKIAIKANIGVKERAWYPIVVGEQIFLNWLAKTKERGKEKKLTRDEKKLLAISLQCSFGDSPLLRLRKTGYGDLDTPDAFTAHLEVWGEFIADNYDGMFERGGEMMTKVKSWRAKNAAVTKT